MISCGRDRPLFNLRSPRLDLCPPDGQVLARLEVLDAATLKEHANREAEHKVARSGFSLLAEPASGRGSETGVHLKSGWLAGVEGDTEVELTRSTICWTCTLM